MATTVDQSPPHELTDPPPPRKSWWRRAAGHIRYDFAGTAFAVAFFCLSLTPSLLPRGWLLQGLIGGISAAIGYGMGMLILWLVRKLIAPNVPHEASTRAWRWLGIVSGALILLFLILGTVWQREIHRLMGLDEPAPASFIAVLLVAVLIYAAFVGLGRLLHRGSRWTARKLGRWVPATAARLIGALVIAALTFGVVNGVLIDGFFSAADASFKTVNGETDPGIEPTDNPLRSGGPGSVMTWASLGNQGRKFVAGGPTEQDLRQFSGTQPVSPIRVYAGIDSAPSASERAALVVRDLQRTGAFSRKLLCVVTTTGTGWVDESAVDPLEYMYNGDTALAGMQYSYLPSWISFLVDKQRAREAGRELFNHVYDAWSALPEDSRPKLVVFGESLGSFGAESAFSGSDDMRNRTDGMLLVGPPNRNVLWREFVADREAGTTEILPIYEQGDTVRFGTVPADLSNPTSAWGDTKVVYLQHPSDPIVWWTPRLILQRPDWLEEPRGADVSSNVRWYPFVTFWQVTGDMAFSTGVPAGHGHSYGAEPVDAWARIAPPDGWTTERTQALTDLIAEKY
jgi:uncharacterized membrane protein